MVKQDLGGCRHKAASIVLTHEHMTAHSEFREGSYSSPHRDRANKNRQECFYSYKEARKQSRGGELMISSLGCLLLHATGVNRAMSSLQSGPVYKYTITFTAELPALPWAQAAGAGQIWSLTLCGMSPPSRLPSSLCCCSPIVLLGICDCACWMAPAHLPAQLQGDVS